MSGAAVATDRHLAVEARALFKRYGPVRALDGIDLEIAPGESILLLGPNGAGKSTLLRVVATLLRPTSGTLRIFGETAAGASRSTARRRVGVLSHQTSLYGHLSALENLEFYAHLYALSEPRARARQALDAAGLGERSSDLVQGLSRGMQQRLAIARAMLHEPDLLILDEPFTGLDRESADRLKEALHAVHRGGRTCLMATHDFTSAAELATRVVILSCGRVAADQPSQRPGAEELERLFRLVTREGTAVH